MKIFSLQALTLHLEESRRPTRKAPSVPKATLNTQNQEGWSTLQLTLIAGTVALAAVTVAFYLRRSNT